MDSSTKVTGASISGIIVGLLVMKGWIGPQDASTLSNAIDAVIGGIIALVSIIGWFEHHIQQERNKIPATPVTTVTTTTEKTPTQTPVTTTAVTQVQTTP